MTRNITRAAAEAGALQMALVLSAKAGWRFDNGPIPPTAFALYLYIGSAQMLLVPTTAGLDFAVRQVEPVVRETRSDALIVSRPDEGPPRFAFATWTRFETEWTSPLTLWLSQTGAAWLVPAEPDSNRPGIALTVALHRRSALPWADDAERRAGFDRATQWMAKAASVIPQG